MMLPHIWHRCKKDGCNICEGGLAYCEVCGALEGSLLSFCPGFKLNSDAINACYNGNVRDLVWFREAIKHGARIKNGRLTWR